MELQEGQTAVQLTAARSLPASGPVQEYGGIIHTTSMPSAVLQPKQERQLRLLQSQLEGHKLRADDFEKQCACVTADLDYAKQRHNSADHRQFQVPQFTVMHAAVNIKPLRNSLAQFSFVQDHFSNVLYVHIAQQ